MRWVLHAEVVNLARRRNLSICSILDRILVHELDQLGRADGIERARSYNFNEPNARPKQRRAVSIRGVVYDRLLEVAGQLGLRLTTLIDDLCVDELERAGYIIERVKTPSRKYRRAGRPRAVKVEGPLREIAIDPDAWFGGYAEFGPGSQPTARIVEPRAMPREPLR